PRTRNSECGVRNRKSITADAIHSAFEMAGHHGFAPCSRRLRAGTSLSKFATRNRRDAKAELNHRNQACEVLADTGIRVAKRFPSAPNPAPGHYFGRARPRSARRIHLGKWTSIRVARPVFRFGRPACISQHLCSKKWNPVLESHQPLRFCKPPPELLGQRDGNPSGVAARPGAHIANVSRKVSVVLRFL